MNSHYRFYVYKRHRLGISGKQIFDELARVHQDPFPSLQTIYQWILEIQMGSFQFEKKKSQGRQFLTVNAANVQRVRLLMPQRESINADYMIQYLKDTSNRFQNLKKDKICLKKMPFQMDNARPDTAAATQNFLASWR